MEHKGDLLFEQEYDMGQGQRIAFSLYRNDEDPHEISVSLYYHFLAAPEQETIYKTMRFPAEAERVKSPYLSWYNLICCSNNYGPIPVVDYMNHSVQNEKKLAATIYPTDAAEYMQMLAEVGEDFYLYPYHTREYEYMLYISRKGKLKDYFDLQDILAVYKDCGIDLDTEKMNQYFDRELSWFGNEEKCSIELHNCLGEEELAVVGLLFGYPVESTVSLLNKTIDEFG